MSVALLVAFVLAAALVPAEIARRKGHGFWTFYLFGIMLLIVAIPVALLVKPRR